MWSVRTVLGMKRDVLLCLLLVAAFIVLFMIIALEAYSEPAQIKIGVLAYRGKDDALKMWRPTADYLKSRITGHEVIIVPLDFHEIDPAVNRSEVDFIIANTAIYVGLEAKYGVARIATIENMNKKGDPTVFGGVIFCRADRADILDLADIKGRSFMAVDETSLGGWLAAWREFRDIGIDPSSDFRSLSFGRTHDAVIYAVRDGIVDAGTVRTDTLEHMAEAGKIKMSSFRILNPLMINGFNFALSTRLYPEWPIAKLRHTSVDTAEMVAVALMGMQHYGHEASAANIKGWTIPLDYQPVHELMKELKVGPYREYGKLTLHDAIRMYWHWIAAAIVLLLSMAAVTLHVIRLNRRLKRTSYQLLEAKAGLDRQVMDRTAELVKTIDELSMEVAVRKEIEEDLENAKKYLTGIVHDINDTMMGVLGNAELLFMKLSPGSMERKLAGEIMYAGDRLACLTPQLLAYNGRGPYEIKQVSLNTKNTEGVSSTMTERQMPVSAAETIMIVDDDEMVLNILQEFIEQLGHPVLSFVDGTEALEAFRTSKDMVKLAILDLKMPVMGGEELFREMKAISPGLKVFISSGFDEDTALLRMGEGRPDGILQKPYSVEELSARLAEVLPGRNRVESHN